MTLSVADLHDLHGTTSEDDAEAKADPIVASKPQSQTPSQTPSFRRGAGAAQAADPTPARTRRANRYGGRCVHCDEWVEEEHGYLTKDAEGRWAPEHAECADTFGEDPPAPRPAPESKPAYRDPEVDEGRYALRGADGVVRFYMVDKPTEGRWAGYTFLSVQAGDDYFPVKGRDKWDRLREIEADPKAATLLYGQEIGACGVCGRTLTDEDSRARGIGPVCAENRGW